MFALTAAVALAQVPFPEILTSLQRTEAGLHGDWWRTFTALFVQDGGPIGAVTNLAFLAVIGTIAEQFLSRPRWLAHYFGIGLLCELVAYSWQPVGGGNSIAVCGLAGAVTLAFWRGVSRLPDISPVALLVWCGALLATLYPPLIIVGFAPIGLVLRLGRESPQARRLTAFTVIAIAVALAVANNIHGAALLFGIALAFATVPGPVPRRSHP